MSDLTVFQFESYEIRFVGTPEKPEWVALDVVAVLYPESDKRNYNNYLRKVSKKWKGHKRIMTLGGEQEVTTLFEPGLYYFLGRSNSEIAIAFQEWLYEEVLPSIRKTGKYELPQAELPPVLSTPTAQEISELFDLTLGGAGLDPRLIAGVKLNAIASYNPALLAATEIAKSALAIPVDESLVRPTQLGEKLSATTGEKWSAIKVNKLLTDQGFQVPNPDKNPSYLPTEKGKNYSQIVLDTAKGRDKTVQSLQWHLSVLETLEIEEVKHV
ncbi:BRO-N domain-containing protein [Nostoc sp.]|uniref:BRO-N domain-containing protein n=1 Tax=Nostoc sp. TaxID=1180 RepID=UPI002FF356E2